MRGGYRQGAGRKLGFAAKEAEEARKVLSEMVTKEIVPIGEALIKQAKTGNIAAARELFDRAWGKLPQTLNGGFEITSRLWPSLKQMLVCEGKARALL